MKTSKKLFLAGLCSLALTAPGHTLAWGEPGHEIIGSLAEQILTAKNPSVEAQVKQLLGGYSLALASTWADCARDVHKSADGTFTYYIGNETPAVCKTFPTSEHDRMIAYVSQNWDQCVYSPQEGCHAAYHFSDIAIQRGVYSDNVTGARPYDIEHAIAAAVAVLEGKPCPAPFKIPDKTIALFLLAHFVGDLHQPLHVGAIYLMPNGDVVDPDKPDGDATTTDTRGGNSILAGSKNLHATWDAVNPKLGLTANAALVRGAAQYTSPTDKSATWVYIWANDSIYEANKTVLDGLTFSEDTTGKAKWDATLPGSYTKTRLAEQTKQLEKAGEHLAQLLVVALSGS